MERSWHIGGKIPYISVIVPVRNEESHIRATLDSLLAQTYPRDHFEVIVVDGHSSDRTEEVVRDVMKRDRVVRLLRNSRRLSSAARNVGVRASRGDVVLIIDGHCRVPRPDLLWTVAECFEQSGADCLGRPQPLFDRENTVFQEAIALARSSWLGHSQKSHIYGARRGYVSPVSVGCAYRRDVFDEIGYFDEGFDACEDVEFNYRVEQAGLVSFIDPRLAVAYSPRTSLSGFIRQMMRYGRGRCRFLRKHPEALDLDVLIPPAFAVGLAVVFGVYRTDPLIGMLLAAPYAGYLGIVLAESIAVAAERNWWVLPYLPVIFVATHIGLGIGFLLECLSRYERDLFQMPDAVPDQPRE